MAFSGYPFHARRPLRLPGRDYTADGAYFVTLRGVEDAPTFGVPVPDGISLNSIGAIVADAWRWLPMQYPYVTLDEWCVMPDHLHGIIVMGASREEVRRRKPLGELIGAFKTVSTKRINSLRQTPGGVVWQRDFWDHIVRDGDDLNRIRAYIRDNPGFL